MENGLFGTRHCPFVQKRITKVNNTCPSLQARLTKQAATSKWQARVLEKPREDVT